MIFIKHESRELFIELEGLKQARDELNISGVSSNRRKIAGQIQSE